MVSKISKIEDEIKANIEILTEKIFKKRFQQSPKLKTENKRLKSENRALSRVVSKLGTQALKPESYLDENW